MKISRYFLIAFFLAGCNTLSPAEAEKLATEICSKVNKDNWFSSKWEESPQEICRKYLRPPAILPCTFGGLPFTCKTDEDGSVTVRRPDALIVVVISPADMARAKPHLQIIR